VFQERTCNYIFMEGFQNKGDEKKIRNQVRQVESDLLNCIVFKAKYDSREGEEAESKSGVRTRDLLPWDFVARQLRL